MSRRPYRRPRADERAVSELVGAVLFFGLLVLLLVLAQVSLVPTLNQQTEYEHSLRAQDDLRDLQSAVYRTGTTGAPEVVPVELGVTYPNRPLLVNPAPVTGDLRTTPPYTDGVVVENVAVPTNAETDDYWSSGRTDVGRYESRLVRYGASYNEYRGPEVTVLEGSVLFERFEGADIVGVRSGLVEGRRIDLTALSGALAESSTRKASVRVAPVSAPTRTVSVEDDGSPITVSVRTLLDEDVWRQRLSTEPYVRSVGYTDADGDPSTPNVLTVTLEPGETYELRMAKVGFGEGVPRADAAYLTREAGAQPAVPESGGRLSVQVRDAFNNPVSGTDVTYRIENTTGSSATLSADGRTGSELTVSSDQDGLASVRLDGTAGYARINASVEVDGRPGTASYETVLLEARIGDGGERDGRTPGEINPNSSGGNLVYVSASAPPPKDKDDNWVNATFRNTGSAPTEVDEVRINQYGPNGQGRSGTTTVPAYAILDLPAPAGQPRLEVGGRFKAIKDTGTLSVGPGRTEVLRFSFYRGDGNSYEVYAGDWFLVTVKFADGTDAVYLVVVGQ